VFPEAIFLGVDLESLLGEEEVWSGKTRVTVWEGHNFWSDHCISIKLLLEYLKAIFLGFVEGVVYNELVLLSRVLSVAKLFVVN